VREIAWIAAVGLALSFWIAVALVRYVRRDRPHKPMPWADATRIIAAQVLLALVGLLDHGARGVFAIAGIALMTLAGYWSVARAVLRRRRGLDPTTGNANLACEAEGCAR
jgi:hypothetical protein